MLKFIAPPIFQDEEKNRIAALLNSILWTVIVIGSLYTVVAPFLLGQMFSAALTATVVLASVIARILMMRGSVRLAAMILLAAFDIILIASIAVSDGVTGASYFSLTLTVVFAGVLLGGRGAYTLAVINTLIGLGFMVFQDSLPTALIPQSPITYFSSLAVYVFFTAALLHASATGFGKLLANFRAAQDELTAKNLELQKFTADLESTIAARTAELEAANRGNERRAKQFEAIARISRAINQTQDFDRLITLVTELISEQFNLYHAGVFLLDANNEYAVLIAANSAGGKRMLARGHKLRIGQTGIVGYVAGSGLPRVALDIGADAIYFNNPDLPETRSEMALPLLRRGNEIIGVLDVQSREPNAFSHEDVRALATLADQVAIAIENSRLFEEQERTLKEAQAVYSRDLRQGWSRFMRTGNIAGIHRRNLKTSIFAEPQEVPGALEATRSGGAFRKTESDGSSLLTLPIKLREQTVGVLNVKAGGQHIWTDDEIDIANAIMQGAALSIENARLLEESRKTAERERAIGEISARIGAGAHIEDILRTAAKELGSRIAGSQVTVEIGGGG
ncbi:MAG: hypothetical protein DCC59_05720 [Chloroflexi bacterium]|nr:GAF domain-containing protein [Chloroflexi bacterium CFX1]MCK6566427.1 GAF domain-containing protein [Anaerolineales bacterium]MCQ3951679.1 hypothetical protein [Chloroflexota bacterium]MDL1919014.1 GAF domain-containing protein [Chloroflexi bacterium CFX5]NUQ57831.1 GAF domain-containing protein [Anaerolineales bacterium]